METSYTTDWVSKHASAWETLFSGLKGQPNLHFLEIGSWEGRSASWFLEHVLTHPTSKITCIDTFEGNPSQQAHSKELLENLEARFDAVIRESGASDRVEKRKGASHEVLPRLPAEHFDAVYVDGSHEAMDTFQDAVDAWRTLKPGGIMLFDDYTWNFFGSSLRKPGPAIDAFLRMYGDELKLIHRGEQVAVRKLLPSTLPDPLPFITVIVPVYNDPMRAERCMRALGVQTYPKDRFEVLMVDNGSDPPLSLPQLPANARLLHEAVPGPAAARNKALREAKGEIAAFTDGDCIPAGDWIEQGVRGIAWDERCAIGGGRIEMFHATQPPSPLQWYDGLTRFDQELFTSQGFSVTANSFMRTEALKRIGGFDVRLLGGAEGLSAYRITQAGYTVHYVPGAVVRHPTESSWKSFLRRNKRAAGGQHDLKRYDLPRSFSPTITQDLRSIVSCAARVRRDPRLRTTGERMRFLAIYTLQRGLRVTERLRLKLGGKPVR